MRLAAVGLPHVLPSESFITVTQRHSSSLPLISAISTHIIEASASKYTASYLSPPRESFPTPHLPEDPLQRATKLI
ncbi:hypothetical protein ACN38_g9871 [Penicillium nordicum]|uniref:Uncharacterized protein n=1 Tax=Penicillium nordicum TaxID=229535 RepID=A0A0M8NTV1_9EURO|nr:hypothetical protein ACN38_g9871 [Penicillium nordicum]